MIKDFLRKEIELYEGHVFTVAELIVYAMVLKAVVCYIL